MQSVQVLLSTYRGKTYLSEQLDSLLKQKDVDIRILIRDDGSDDGTLELLSGYSVYHNVKIIYGKNIGVVASFLELLKLADVDCNYFAYCDQDDVWLEEKLSRAIQVLSVEDNSIPLLYTSRANIVDEKLMHIAYWERPRKEPSFYNAMIQNISTGNTQVFNRQLLSLLLKLDNHKNIAMHDHFSYLLASAFGKIVFDEQANILYRQHGLNVIGMKKGFIKSNLFRIRSVLSGELGRIPAQLRYFLELYGKQLNSQYKKEAERFVNGDHFLNRLLYLLIKKAYCQKLFSGCIFWSLFLFGFIKL